MDPADLLEDATRAKWKARLGWAGVGAALAFAIAAAVEACIQ